MSERKINLEDLLINHCNNNMLHWLSAAEYRKSFLLDAMKEAVKQALELAAENATTTLYKSGKQIEIVTPILEPQYYEKGNGDLVSQGYAQVGTKRQLKYENESIVVDKQSILNTINQIE